MKTYIKIFGIGILLYIAHTPVNAWGLAALSIMFTAVYYWVVGLIAQRHIKEEAITKLCVLGTPMILFDVWATIYNDALWLTHTPFTTILGLLFLFHGYYFRYNSIKKWLMLLALTMIVYIVAFPLVPLISMQKRTSTPPNTFINQKFPLVEINTRKVLHLTKGKTYYLDFFHTRCGYCIEKMPTIESLYQSIKQDTNVCVIAICDGRWDTNIENVQKFPEIQSFTFPIVYDSAGLFCKDLYLYLYPVSIIVDTTGKVQYMFEGYSGDMINVYENTIIEKLSEVKN